MATPTDAADATAATLAGIAGQLAGRVRTDEPAEFQAWLHGQMRTAGLNTLKGWMSLSIVLACAVDSEVPFRHLTAWTSLRPGGDDTPEVIAHRRQILADALQGAPGRHKRRDVRGPTRRRSEVDSCEESREAS